MIQNKSTHIEIILNDHPEPVRLIRISKKRLRRFFLITPVLLVGLFLALAATIWWRGSSMPMSLDLPDLPSTDETQLKELQAQLVEMENSNKALQEKMTASLTGEIDVWIGPVKKPYALQDLRLKKLLRTESIVLEDNAGRRVLKFNLINNGTDADRVYGHVFVFQIDSRGQSAYPAMTNQEWIEGIRFNKGESFAVSRLRPVEANFPPADNDARFLIVIFNREGDLILRQVLSGTTVVGE